MYSGHARIVFYAIPFIMNKMQLVDMVFIGSVFILIAAIDLHLVERRAVWAAFAFTVLSEIIYFTALFISIPVFGDETSVVVVASATAIAPTIALP